MSRFLFLLFFLPLLCFGQMLPLKVSENGRFLIQQDGTPFFYLGDTAWELFHRLSREEIDYYLRDRAAKGFSVIQCVVLAELDGLTVSNAEDQLPLIDGQLDQPNEAYFELIDYALKRAETYGLYLGILPTWGVHLEEKAQGLFDAEKAFRYGQFLGKRWKGTPNLFWILGGDRGPEGKEEIWDKLALGLHKGDGGRLMTYHIYGGRSSSDIWHQAPWLDFNMIQSGHMHPFAPTYEMVAKDYAFDPPKPTLDGEPNYEGLPIGFREFSERFTDTDVRRASYWSVFAGACGVTYGHNSIWQMAGAKGRNVLWAKPDWQEALLAPGSGQMGHLRRLMESRPYLNRIPDQEILLGNGTSWPAEGTAANHVQATRDGTPGQADATYLMVYYPYGYDINLNTQLIDSDSLRIWWFDPRTGRAYDQGIFPNAEAFRLPSQARIRPGMGGPDWVLVIDDASKGYGRPGE